MPSLLEERAKLANGVFDPSHKRGERTETMNSYLADDEKIPPSMLTHQDSADLAPACLSERRQQ